MTKTHTGTKELSLVTFGINTITTFRAAYDLVYSDSYPLIGRGGDEDGEEINQSSEGVGTESNHSSSSSPSSTIEREGVISSLSSSSSSAIVSNSALNNTMEKVDDKMEHSLPASIAVETREKTIDELSREANANREAILDALMAQYGFEDGGGDGGEGQDESRSRKKAIAKEKREKKKKEKEDEKEKVVPTETRKRKRSPLDSSSLIGPVSFHTIDEGGDKRGDKKVAKS